MTNELKEMDPKRAAIVDLNSLIIFLQKKDYKSIEQVPLRKYPFSPNLLLNEIGVFFRILMKRDVIFSISMMPFLYAHLGMGIDVKSLRDFFFLNKGFSLQCWENVFGGGQASLWVEKGFLRKDREKYYFIYRIVPFKEYLLITSRFDRKEPHFTFLSYDSFYFSSFLYDKLKGLSFKGRSGLDICCGVGIQAFTIAPFCERVLGVDINQNAIELANLNAQYNHFNNCEFRKGALYENINEKFDFIVANPPFVFFADKSNGSIDSNGGEPFGLGVTFDILSNLHNFCKDDGRAYIITRSPVLDSGDYLFNNLGKHLNGKFGCIYHHVSDYIKTLSPAEKSMGISAYKQIILEIFKGSGYRSIQYPFFHRKTTVF